MTYYPLFLWLKRSTQPGNINYPIAIFIIVIIVCYVGMVYGPIGAFLAEYFPGQDSLHVGVGAVSHRQRLGRRTGAVHHDGGVRRKRQHRATR